MARNWRARLLLATVADRVDGISVRISAFTAWSCGTTARRLRGTVVEASRQLVTSR